MKKNIFKIMIAAMFFAALALSTAKDKTIPSVKVKDLKKKTVDTKTFDNDGKPIVITFWATWCKPCLQEMATISDLYSDWQDATGVKIIAVSIDDSRNSSKVPGLVNSKGWDFDVYIDENQDFKRAMGVNNPPHTFLIDGKGNIVWEHNGYAPGDEKELYKKIKELSKQK